jgi:transcriptional regulator with XRE-family HTH domain
MTGEFIFDRLCEEKGLSVAEVCRISTVSRSTCDDIRRRGGVGRGENLDKLAKALGLESRLDLFEGGTPPEDEKYQIDNKPYIQLLDSAAFHSPGLIELRKRIERFVELSDDVDSLSRFSSAEQYRKVNQFQEALDQYELGLMNSQGLNCDLLHHPVVDFLELCVRQRAGVRARKVFKFLEPRLDRYLASKFGLYFAGGEMNPETITQATTPEPRDPELANRCFEWLLKRLDPNQTEQNNGADT